MVAIQNLSKSFGARTLFAGANLDLRPLARYGLVGANGSGKTTLMRIISGDESASDGQVTYPKQMRLGVLKQDQFLGDNERVIDVAMQGDREVYGAIAEQSQLMNSGSGSPDRIAELDEFIRVHAGWTLESRSAEILAGLGIPVSSQRRALATLSGGFKLRVLLAQVLVSRPDLLLLDEPTNHLDIGMLEWLEEWLNHFRGAALIVSHDRAFLDNTVNRILDLSPETHTIQAYAGNYSLYLEQYLVERENRWDDYRDQVAEIRRMKQDINRTKQQALNVERTTTSRQPGVRRYAKKVAQKALSRQKKLDRYLASEERVERPIPGWQLKLDFSAPAHQSREVLVTEKLAIGYPGIPPLMEKINMNIHGGERLALTGPNGCGKTTLLRTIAGNLEPLAGFIRLGASVKLGYMTQEQEHLDLDKSPLETIQSVGIFTQTEARHFLHFFLFRGDDPLRLAKSLSYGERTRLELALLVAEGCTFLLLDEPINHLDIPSRTRFEQALARYTGTVLAVIHDRYFIEHLPLMYWWWKEAESGKGNLWFYQVIIA